MASGSKSRVLLVVSAVLILDASLYAAVTPLLPGLRDEFKISDGGAGLLVATYAIGLLVAAVPAGWLTARIGARAAMVLGLALFGIAGVGFGLGTSIEVIDLMRGLQGVAAALSWVAGFVWLLAVGPKDRQGLLIGTAIAAAVAGTIAGPALGVLAVHFGRPLVFVTIAMVGVALAAAIRLLPPPHDEGDLRFGAALGAVRRGAGATGAWLILLAATLFGAIAVLAPLELDELGAGATTIGAIFLGVGLSEIVVSPWVGRLGDRIGVRIPLLVALTTAVVLLFALMLAGSLSSTIVILAVLFPAITAIITPAFATLARVVDERRVAAGAVFGLGNLAWAGGEGFGALFAGWLRDASFGDATYVVLAALALGTLAVLQARGERAFGAGEVASSRHPAPRSNKSIL